MEKLTDTNELPFFIDECIHSLEYDDISFNANRTNNSDDFFINIVCQKTYKSFEKEIYGKLKGGIEKYGTIDFATLLDLTAKIFSTFLTNYSEEVLLNHSDKTISVNFQTMPEWNMRISSLTLEEKEKMLEVLMNIQKTLSGTTSR